MGSLHRHQSIVLKNSIVYAVSEALGHSYALISVPLLTRHLTAEQWAKFALILVLSRVYNLATSGLFSQGVTRLYVDKDEPEQRRFVGAIAAALFVFSAVGFAAVVLTGRTTIPWFLPAIGGLEEHQAFLIAAWLALSPFRPFCMSLIKITEQVRYLAVVNLVYGAGYLGTIAVGVVRLKGGIDAALLSLLAGEAVALASVTPFLWRRIAMPRSMMPAWECLRFTIPLMVASAIFVMFTQADRFVLARVATVEEISAYSVGAMIALLPATLVSSIIAPATARVLRVHATDGTAAALTLTRQLIAVQLPIAVLGCGGFIVCLAPLLTITGGPYGSSPIATATAAALTCGHLTRLVYLFSQNTLFCLKRRQTILVLNILLLAVGVISAYLLHQSLGSSSVGWYFAISYVSLSVASSFIRVGDDRLGIPLIPVIAGAIVMSAVVMFEVRFTLHHQAAWSHTWGVKAGQIGILAAATTLFIAGRRRGLTRS